MKQILLIDDEIVFHTLVTRSLEGFNFLISTAENGKEGLAKARSLKPSLIICDVNMPDISGYDVVRTLRREADFAKTPILMLTAQTGLHDKLDAFESGVDEFLTKPFEPAELAARVNVLMRRAEAESLPQPSVPVEAFEPREQARMIVVHSLRGGTGCSSLAVNLALGLESLWNKKTILLDLTMMAGQVALMLNAPLKRTWADIARYAPDELDSDVIKSIISRHESGLDFIAAPTLPTEADTIKHETLGQALRLIKSQYDYVIVDLPHDFHEFTLQALDITEMILMVATPDMASVRACAAALDTYKKLGFSVKNQIRLLINATFPRLGLQHDKIAAALGIPVSALIGYSPDLFVEAINAGKPFILSKSADPVSELIEDYSFNISKPDHKKTRPEEPTKVWLRVYKRYSDRKK